MRSDCCCDMSHDGIVIAPTMQGIAELASWLHARNFKFGLYLSAGWTTCSTGGRNVPFIPGSIGHYQQDADTVASWGTDYVKVRAGHGSLVVAVYPTTQAFSRVYGMGTYAGAQLDWCGTTNAHAAPYILNQQNATTGFTTAANKTGRAMWMNFHCDHTLGNIPDVRHAMPATQLHVHVCVLTCCLWLQWCSQDGNSWRMAEDHHDNWSDTIQVINNLKFLAKFGRPHRWNDPDFLMTGGAGCDKNVTGLRCPGQTNVEYMTTFSLWAMAAAPLIVSTDVRNWTPFMKSVLLNKEIIAVDQDPLGIAGGLVANWTCNAPVGSCQVWVRPLSDGSYAAAMFNANDDTHSITTQWSVIPGAGWDATTSVEVRDLWAHKDLGAFTGSYSATIPAHGTVMVQLRKA